MDHLRDELWRVWLRVEYLVRRRWELGALPRASDDIGTGMWSPESIGGLFRAAHAKLAAGRITEPEPDAGSQILIETYHRHSTLIDARVRETLEAGIRLPLIELAQRFELTPFQQGVLSFAIMPELEPDLIPVYRYLSHDPNCRALDGRLLCLLVYDSLESRVLLTGDLSPASPLIRYRLIEQDDPLGSRDSLLFRRLRPALRLINWLRTDSITLDPLLQGVATLPSSDVNGLFPQKLVAKVEHALRSSAVAVILQGVRGVGKKLLAQVAAQEQKRPALVVKARQLTLQPPEQAAMMVGSLLREQRLLDAVMVIADVDDAMTQDSEREELPRIIGSLCAQSTGPLCLTFNGERLPRIAERPLIHFRLNLPNVVERTALWQQNASMSEADSRLLAERYAAPGGVIAMAALAGAASASRDKPPSVQVFDQAIRSQFHDRISRLGRKLNTPYTLEDLVVEDIVWDTLCEIVACMKMRHWVRETWGLRGAPGVSVLFSGDPGVGKTMSATALARDIGLDIYEIDLASVVSKWIGETEKNLSDVFDAAEPGHIVLLFNEADSLFGKRTTDVKTSNDRYANLEVNYLLQRLERFGGLAILTTNLSKAIDPAFRRRFAYDVQYSFPTMTMREELWRRTLPASAIEPDLDYAYLAERFSLSGGYIKVATERAAHVAAGVGQRISLEILVATIERMYQERGKLAAVGELE